MTAIHQGSGYISTFFAEPNEILNKVCSVLRGFDAEYDLLVCTGTSGLIITPTLAYRMNKPFAVVRKKRESLNAGSNLIEGHVKEGYRWLWVDDFISSGDTRNRVDDAFKELDAKHGVPTTKVGQVLWSDLSMEVNGTRYKL